MAKWTFTPAEESSSSTEEENELSDWTFTPAPTRSEVEEPEPREITPERSVVESTVPALPEIPAPEVPQVNINPVTPVGVAPVRPETIIQKPKPIIPEREDVAIVDPVLAPRAIKPTIPKVDVAPVVPDSQAFKPKVKPEAVSQIESAQAVEKEEEEEAREEKAPRVSLPVLYDDVVSDVEEIRRREAQPFETLKGELELPIRGAVGTAFYYDFFNRDSTPEKFGTINKNAKKNENSYIGAQGIFVPSKSGDSVRSVANGTVVYAGFLRGYGDVVIVDHGQGFNTVYGNNESTTVKTGDQIKTGDQLGTAGTLMNNQPGTYFEVRRNSEVIDPMEWISSTAGVGEAAEKGIKTTIEQFKMTAPAIQLQAASNQIVNQRNLLSVFDRLDNGEQLPSIIQSLIPEREELPSGAPYGSRRLLSEELSSFGGAPGLTKEQTDINNLGRAYLEASPEEKAQMRAAANEIITNGTKFAEEIIPEIYRFLETTTNLRKGIPRLNEVKSAKDVAALLSYYATQGLAQIAPLVIAGAATKSKGAVVSLAGTMNLGGSVTQRFNYLMNAFKGIESTDEKAEALIEYLEKTGDDTLKQAILNTGLDSFFGVVGASTRAKYAEELGKGTVRQQAKEVAKQVGSETVTEGTQAFIDAATAVKLRETKNALFSKETFNEVLEAALAGGLGAGTFKAVEIPTGIGLRKTVETYKDSRVKAVLDGIFDRLTPKEKEFVDAQNEAGTSPSETLDLLQITFGQKKDPARVLDPDGNEIADAIGSENAKDITEFVNANKKITEEVENGNYTEQEADVIADKVFTLIEQEGMTGDAAFAQAKKEADDARGGEKGKPVLVEDKTQTEEQDQTKEQSSLPVEYVDIINDPNINSQAELFSRMAEAAVAREKQAQEQSQTQAQTQTSAQLPPPDLTEYGDAAPAIEAATLEADRIADEEQSVPLPNPEEIPLPTEAEVKSAERIIEDNEALADPNKPDYTVDEYFNADPDNPKSSFFERVSILPNIVSDVKNRKDIFKYIDNLDARKWTPILATLPTDDLSRLFEFKTRNILNFKDGVDENHLSNVSEVVRDLNREQGEIIKRYSPLIESWSDFIKKSNVSPREYRDRVKNGKVIKGARSRGVQLSRVMNLSRRLKVDPSKQTYEALTTPTVDRNTGEVLTDPKILNLLEEQKLAVANPNVTETTIKSINKELAERRRDVRELYDQWEDLTDSPYGQQAANIYTGTLQAYREIFDTYEQVLLDNIKSLGVDQKTTDKLIEDTQKSFAEKRISEPVYIQAVRNGDYYVRIPKTLTLKGTPVKVPGTSGTVFLNSPGEVKDFKRRVAEIYEVDVTNSKEIRSGSVANYISDVKEEDPGGLLQRIINAIDESTTVNSKEGKQNLKDMIGQIWLQSLPASNVKVLFGSRREGTFGESDDILQGFANTIKSVSNQFPRIRHANKMRNEVSAAREQITGVPNQEALEKIITEVEKRINLELTPPGGIAHAIARGANKFTFAYLLSAPKTALVQLTQYPLVMAPVLNEYFGESVGYATTKATVLRYLALPNTLGFGKLLDLDQNNPGRMEWPSVVLSRYIQGTGPGTLHRRILVEAGAYSPTAQQQADEFIAFMKYAWTQADLSGVLRQTYGSDLGGGLTLPSVYEPGVKAGVNRGAAFMFDVMTGLFSNMERLNRELSFMSAAELAYREAKKQGLVGEARDAQALSRAFEATREGALDFTNFNKPRFMKETAVGISSFQFTSFTLLMQSLLARRAYRAMALMDKRYTRRDRLAAIETFVTIQLGTAVLAGIDKMYGGAPLAAFILGMSVGLMGLLTDMNEEYEERTKKEQARAAKLLEVQKKYEKWLSLPDTIREKVKIPRQLTQSEMDELITLKAVDSAKLWREAMKDHPRYSGLLNFKDYFRDIVLPSYIGVGGKVADYFNMGEDSRINKLSVLKDGLPAYYGADISRNTSLSNIFYNELPPDPNPGVYDMAIYTAQNFNIAPFLSTYNIMATGAKAAVEKNWRKFFKSSPRFYSNLSEQAFLKTEGAEDYMGVPLRDFNSDYYTAGKLTFGAGGFSDKFVSDLKNAIYKDNKFVAIVKQDRQDILDEWKDLMGGLLKGALKIGIDKLVFDKNEDMDLLDPEVYNQIDPDFLDKLNELKLKVEDFNFTYSDLIDGQYISTLTLTEVRNNRLAKIYTANVSNGLLNSEDSPLNNLIKLQRLKGTINLFPKGTSQKEMTKRFDEIEARLNSQYEEYILKAREEQKKLIERGVLDEDGSPFINP